MEYYEILNLNREPFSNSPDPDFFFRTNQHQRCLQRLEIAVRLRRGLNVVVGDVGTGKTTLCRQLIWQFEHDEQILFHLILDPGYPSATALLRDVAAMVADDRDWTVLDEAQLKEIIKKGIYRLAVDEGKNLVLIIDEGQKLAPFCLEILRELLNYETNANKLLQIVIFAQPEIEGLLRAHVNFADRINYYQVLGPMRFRDSRAMIRYRVHKCQAHPEQPLNYFSLPALWQIHRATGGYPRQIIHLCHRCVMAMIIKDQRKVTYATAKACASSHWRQDGAPSRRRLPRYLALAAVALLCVVLVFYGQDWLRFSAKEQSPLNAQVTATAKPPAVDEPSPAHTVEKTIQPQSRALVEAPEPVVETAPAANTEKPVAEIEMAALKAAEEPKQETARVQSPPSPIPAPAPSGEVLASTREASFETPTLLGEVPLAPNVILSKMIARVYGRYNPQRLAAVARANPQIPDFNRLQAGEPIRLPLERVDLPSEKTASLYWIRLQQSDRIEPMLAKIRQHPKSLGRPKMIAYWVPESGIHFAVGWGGFHTQAAQAQQKLAALPREMAVKAQVIHAWPPGTVFLTDPFEQ